MEFMDLVISNEDVKNSKPAEKCIGININDELFVPEETLIVEDSPYGLL